MPGLTVAPGIDVTPGCVAYSAQQGCYAVRHMYLLCPEEVPRRSPTTSKAIMDVGSCAGQLVQQVRLLLHIARPTYG